MDKEKKLLSTREVYEADGCSKPAALRWANKNGVSKVGTEFVWTRREANAFHNRDQSPGRRPVKKRGRRKK